VHKTALSPHSRSRIAPVAPRISGGSLERVRRAVYQGVREPDSPRADAAGRATARRSPLSVAAMASRLS